MAGEPVTRYLEERDPSDPQFIAGAPEPLLAELGPWVVEAQPGTWYPTDGDAPAREVAGELRDAARESADEFRALADAAPGTVEGGRWRMMQWRLEDLWKRAREGGDV